MEGCEARGCTSRSTEASDLTLQEINTTAVHSPELLGNLWADDARCNDEASSAMGIMHM